MDGKGWFLTQEPDRMLYFDQRGHGKFVHNVGYWVTPSWDGKRLAFIARERQFDAYLARR